MTAVDDPPLPRTAGGPAGAAYPHLELALARLAMENTAHAVTTADGPGYPEAELIDQITELQALQNTAAALQTATIRAFARSHAAAHTATGHVDPDKLDRSIRAQVALATRASPTVAAARVRTARDLHDGLELLALQHAAGLLGADVVAVVAAASEHLDHDGRAELDRRLSAHDLTRLGLGRVRDLARSLAARIDPQGFRDRAVVARSRRRVTVRPAPDGMAYLTAYLPMPQAVACLAALTRAHTAAQVDPAPLTRTRGQHAADTLVERLTGAAEAGRTDLELQVLVPLEVLVDPDNPLPVEIPGYGPVPADLLATAGGRLSWRRLVTRRGVVVGGECRRRRFTGALAGIIRARTRHRCAEPYCDAPVRHIDHIHRGADGGPADLDNGRGVCEFHNQVREQPGWRVHRTPDGVTTTTPTGHTHTVR